jgi:hypothetical protein
VCAAYKLTRLEDGQTNTDTSLSFANSQIRLVLARLLWNFDFEALPGIANPHDFLEYGTWQVEPLMVRVTDARGSTA